MTPNAQIREGKALWITNLEILNRLYLEVKALCDRPSQDKWEAVKGTIFEIENPS